MENKAYKGQIALITGGTSGIGLELARCFAKDGYNIILVARTQEDLETVAQELTAQYGVKAYGIAADLMRQGAAEKLYEEIKLEGLQIDVLVNDAGQGVWGKFTETDLQKELDIIQLNIVATVILTKLFLKDMVARNSGKVLQLASTSSKAPTPLLAVYAGTKAFVYNFTQGLINELKDTNVTMTALLPGPTETDFFNKAGAEHTVVYQEKDLADPADVAKDGYEALQKGESKIVSGMKNKLQITLGNILPDEALAENYRKQMNPSKKDK
ncbi:oxidoreductase [Flavobacterium cyanobacteriorum]|uniref:Oxidoreductase n=2 Tax=Flavobacterium cyanobacteriorum TaxID=2022802 RepID=A0A255Z9H9_9FLAO|nr:oxidoreductase [Flavobacterium cyanobacteriorum]